MVMSPALLTMPFLLKTSTWFVLTFLCQKLFQLWFFVKMAIGWVRYDKMITSFSKCVSSKVNPEPIIKKIAVTYLGVHPYVLYLFMSEQQEIETFLEIFLQSKSLLLKNTLQKRGQATVVPFLFQRKKNLNFSKHLWSSKQSRWWCVQDAKSMFMEIQKNMCSFLWMSHLETALCVTK